MMGSVTVIHDSGLKSWGNNCACYPEVTDMKERWIACRRMFTYVANYFILNYLSELDEPMNKNKIDDIVNSFNIWGNSLVSRGMCGRSAGRIQSPGQHLQRSVKWKAEGPFLHCPVYATGVY